MSKNVYNNYRNCEIDWLDKIPSHWKTIKLKWFSRIYAGGTPDKEDESFWNNGTIPWINSGSVNQGLITTPSELITKQGLNSSSAKWIPKGALVMALAGQGKTKGMVAQLGIKTTCNQSMAAIIPDKRIFNRYVLYWLIVNYQNIRNLGGGNQRDGLNLVMIGNIQCPIPPIKEQQSIANYLDKETTRLDALISKKQQLIKTLKEKRVAIISEAVSKGVNPNAKMKDSGVEWLGDIPEHWEVKKLKYMSKINPPASEIKDLKPTDLVSFVPMESIKENGGMDTSKEKSLEEVKKGFTYFRENDIVIAKITPCFENGKGSIAYNLKNKVAFGTTELHVVRCNSELLYFKFYFYITNSDRFMKLGEASMYGAGGQKRVPTEFIKDYHIAYPKDLNEQIIISDYLESEMDKLNIIFQKTEQAIQKLQEYKTALISAAVTGKIKVPEQA